MKKYLFWTKTEDVETLKSSLCNNKISICTTDTILGLLCPIFEQSFNQLCSIKNRSTNKSFIILISDCNKLGKFIDIDNTPAAAIKFAESCWPSAVTIVFKAKKTLPRFMVDDRGTIALRCPQHSELRDLLSSLDGLFSTSLNKSGDEPYQSTDKIDDEIIGKVEYIVQEKEIFENKPSSSSSIVEFVTSKNGKLELSILRSGSIPDTKLKEIYEKTRNS